MTKQTFPKQDLIELLDDPDVGSEWNGYTIVANDLVDTTRWATVYSLIFQVRDKFGFTKYYAVRYRQGEEERPFQNSPDDVPCTEVQPVEVKITKYEPI